MATLQDLKREEVRQSLLRIYENFYWIHLWIIDVCARWILKREDAAGKLDLGSGRLITYFDFDANWDSWEVHPNGEEVVCLVAGSVDFLLEEAEGTTTVELRKPGAFVLIPRGTWHTAKVLAASSLLVITAGEGTEHRPV